MQLSKSVKLARELIDKLESFFDKRIEYYKIYNHKGEPYIFFNIMFEIYNYFIIELGYNNGIIGCRIVQGNSGITIDLIREWNYDGNLEDFLKEFDFLIKLRIPDKYLEHNGWK